MANSVLLVEDDERDLELFQAAFALAGHASELCHAPGVDEALRALDARAREGSHFALRIVMPDLRLGAADGVEALRRIRADGRFGMLPVVVFTDSEARDDTMRSYAAGANAYVVKPATLAELVDAVRAIAGFWLGRNVLPGDFEAVGWRAAAS